MKKDSEEKFEVFNSFKQQTNNFCWTLEKPESTMSLGSRLTKKFPKIRILLLNGPLGAGKTTLVKGIAKSLKIKEPITSPTFPLSQHYPLGSPPLIHLDLYRIDEPSTANEFFLQEEEEAKAMGALMVVEWPERLSLPMNDAWRGKLEYCSENKSRFFQLIPPLEKDSNLSISSM
ncbi:tRNA (adenosine(37)-N6)-threonylcarbamoyltransferase complex ATPase subunit type 1 TsaE [Prochlorococcus marinus]|uniref:tRNA threonylcarbamoyladenosine biosynthesis protein TsaE n=1 Tax=Prochlorococcus marinus XMU1408 TaxID=2213228 RepID=A0A318QY08_PROMR|nr:tRNA (adenosine(37)-N6)-threonylcarbamoyltransferase complex ATPase subunit type 1 TsaE [Prochlorococcus marinus]MBW3042852.1 tRNA (adenosine(37)-N6)-threonylcarbamoyltransferase complex ATPase subunit type 1 TsaE [Prochlorococcus marinus str. XMU1408]PYE00678.1 tRNA (adenosine(37)-N6)-threonylcarbamoyltransferase complex ATPase subunit type 1 TsaE [Prochlorococcus marinus XMU1408]